MTLPLDSKIYVAGHRGMAGSALVRKLESLGYTNIIKRTHAELDLEDAHAVNAFFEAEKPDYVFVAAAKVGGLFANAQEPATFFLRNLLIYTHVIDAAYRHGAKKLMLLGSSCVYPLIPDRKIVEEDLLTGALEPSNEGFAIAKIAGIQMCSYYRRQYGFDAITVMLPNLIGPNDDFNPQSAHVAQGIMARMHMAKENGDDTFTVWGSGTPRREYMDVDDFADAAVFLMNQKTGSQTMFNVGTGEDHSIWQIAEVAQKVTGFTGKLVNDPSKPDGTPRKTMDTSKLFALGWRPTVGLEDAMQRAFEDHMARQN